MSDDADNWEIPRESLTFEKRVGARQFTEVWQGSICKPHDFRNKSKCIC